MLPLVLSMSKSSTDVGSRSTLPMLGPPVEEEEEEAEDTEVEEEDTVVVEVEAADMAVAEATKGAEATRAGVDTRVVEDTKVVEATKVVEEVDIKVANRAMVVMAVEEEAVATKHPRLNKVLA